MAKIIKELLTLLWKLVRTYVMKWLRTVLSKVFMLSTVILALVLLVAFFAGRC